MRKIIIKKGEEKIKIPLGIYINSFIIKAESVIQCNKESKKEKENGMG